MLNKKFGLIILFSVTLTISILKIFPPDLYRINFEEYNLNTKQNSILLGKSNDTELTLVNSKIEDKHLKMNFLEDQVELLNISKKRKVDVNNRYISSIKLSKNDTIFIGNDKYVISKVPKLSFVGITGELLDNKHDKKSIFHFAKKYFYLSDIKENDLYKNYYIKLQFERRIYELIFDAFIISFFISLLFILIFIFRQNLLLKDKLFRSLLLLSFYVFIIIFFGLFPEYYPFNNWVEPYLKTVNFNQNHQSIVKINSSSIKENTIKLSYQNNVEPESDRIIMGYTRYNSQIRKDSTNTINVKLKPENSAKFVRTNVEVLHISNNVSSKSDFTLNFPNGFGTRDIDIREKQHIISNDRGDYLEISIEKTSKNKLKYFIWLGIVFLISTLFVYFDYVGNFKFNSLFIIIFGYILLQGLILLHNYSYFNLRDQHLFSNFVRNISLGFIFLFFTYIIINLKYFWLSTLKYNWQNMILKILKIIFICLIGILYFLSLNIFVAVLLSASLFLITFIVKNKSKTKDKNSLSKLLLGITVSDVYIIISIMVGLIIIQALAGGELGFNFLGTNIQLFELVKIVLTIIIVIALSANFRENTMLIPPYSSWIVILPILAVLTFALKDFSPIIIFFMLFVVSLLIDNYDEKVRIDQKYHPILEKVILITIRNTHWIIISIFTLLFVGLANRSLPVLITGLCGYILIVSAEILYRMKVSYKNGMILGLLFIILPIIIILIVPMLPDQHDELQRISMWQDHWQSSNSQFIHSLYFLQHSKSYITNLNLVPVLDDDMIFSFYLNRFGLLHFIILFAFPMLLLARNALHYFKKDWKHLGDKKQLISLELFFLTALFIIQNLIVLSNVTGLLPIMGQPAPGISYSASNLIFFFFGIFLLLMILDSEYRSIKIKKLSTLDVGTEHNYYVAAYHYLSERNIGFPVQTKITLLDIETPGGSKKFEVIYNDGIMKRIELNEEECSNILVEEKS